MRLVLAAVLFACFPVAACTRREPAPELQLFAWSEYVPDEVVDGFTTETGIRVNRETFASNEEMLAKLLSGATHYDVVQPSDYTAEALAREGRLRPIDWSKVPGLRNLAPEFLHLPHDPDQKYTLPWMGGTVGIVVNAERVSPETVRSYADVFRGEHRGRIAVVDDPREIVSWALATVACLVLAWPVAWTIARAHPRRRTLLLALVVVPFWTSFLIRTYAWVTILKGEGLLNGALLAAGIVAAPIEMLYTPGAVLVGLVHTFLPFAILPLYAAIEALDPALFEAAADLGAGPVRTLREVVLPLTRPGIEAAALLIFVPALGLYAVNDILGGGRVDMIGNLIADQFKGAARDWPFGAALSVTLLLAFALAWRLAGRGRSLAAGLDR